MTLGERIKACRQKVGMSQEKVAELVGVSRQAVTKWETNQSAPNTENLFKLAEIFGTTVDLLLTDGDEDKPSLAEQVYSLYKLEEEKRRRHNNEVRKKNGSIAVMVAAVYLMLYLIGRMIWCDLSQSSLMGWLFTARPAGENSYLYGWLLSSRLFWFAMAVSVLPAFWGKHTFSLVTTCGCIAGLLLGIVFGPNPEGAPYGQSHYGWAIWGGVYLFSAVVGILLERLAKKDWSTGFSPGKKSGDHNGEKRPI